MRLPYRGNLSAKSFPFLISQHGQTTIQKGIDQTFERSLVSREDPDRDIGIPQVYYVENALPSATGFYSVGGVKLFDAFPTPPVGSTYVKVDAAQLKVFGEEEKEVYVALLLERVAGVFTNLVFCLGYDGTWKTVHTVAYSAAAGTPTEIYVAAVSGSSYILVKGYGLFQVNSLTAIAAVTMTSLVQTDVIAVTSYQGYLLAATDQGFYWSSSVDPLDFTPSLATGAGGGKVEQRSGDFITMATGGSGVFLFYRGNIVYAAYSTNERYPFILREIPDSGGTISRRGVSYGELQSKLIAVNSSGIQEISPATGADSVFPDAADYLTGLKKSGFPADTDYSVSLAEYEAVVVGDRYRCFSRGILGEYSEVIVYDAVLKRWGRLNYPHWKLLSRVGVSKSPIEGFCIILATGEIYTLCRSLDKTPDVSLSPSLVLGKYRYVRQAQLFISDVFLSNVGAGTTIKAWIGPDWKPVGTPYSLSQISYQGKDLRVGESPIGDMISLQVSGDFDLNSVVINFVIAGDT